MAILRFIKNNKILFIVLLLAVIVTCLPFVCFDFFYYFYDLISQLSIGFIVSFIFYIIVVKMKENKNIKNINKCIENPLKRLIINMEQSIYSFNKDFKDKIDLTENDFELALSKVSPNDEMPILLSFNVRGNRRDYLHYHIMNVENNIDIILNYSNSIDSNLLVILNKILYSSFHEEAKAFMNFKKSFNGAIKDNSFNNSFKEVYQYYLIFLKLKDYIKNNKIE